ncbi:MAG: ATP-dependent RecD-like DNA helicase [Actinobacteria bacterium]|nr:ATP-dependent RecD-like DNA helicase [Actinomycetota bacterium]
MEKILFKNPDSGYIVGRLRLKNNDQVTIVGNVFELQCGERLEVTGRWVFNKNYGRQFEIERVKTYAPSSLSGIENYLSSGLIKGIGPVTAAKIVSCFGLDTLRVMDEEPGKLSRIEGIGKKRIALVIDSWNKYKKIREVMMFLQSCGISPAYAVKIYNNYGDNAINVIKLNPYRLAEDVFGIGFKMADRIAINAGISKDSLFRIQSGIIYLLKKAEEEGHCYLPYEKLLEVSSGFLESDLSLINSALGELEKEEKIIIVEDDFKKVYHKSLYAAEKYCCGKILDMLESGDDINALRNKKEAYKDIIKKMSETGSMMLDDLQIEAVVKALTEKILVITGSPGTGKSTILNFIINLFERENKKVLLGAPTGRASKRITEITGREAKTIHRLLSYNPKLNKFMKNEENMLDASVIIIDEASMLDIRLIKNLLKALKCDTKLVLVGDIDQLPSVGPGNVLKDIINSGIIPVVELKNIYRQEGQSMIIRNAHKVRDGIYPAIGKNDEHDFFFIEKNDPGSAVNIILYLVNEKIPKKFGFDPLKDIQVLVPTNKGICGVDSLNEKIQDMINPANKGIPRGSINLKVNDRVIQLRNNYEKDIFNGDIGFIKDIEPELKEIYVDFDGRIVSYGYYELDELNLSYAISIHKAQGSEFRCVIVPLLTSHYLLLQRNLLYTALTRARELAVLVGSKKAIGIAVNRNMTENRYTGLKEMLKNY